MNWARLAVPVVLAVVNGGFVVEGLLSGNAGGLEVVSLACFGAACFFAGFLLGAAE